MVFALPDCLEHSHKYAQTLLPSILKTKPDPVICRSCPVPVPPTSLGLSRTNGCPCCPRSPPASRSLLILRSGPLPGAQISSGPGSPRAALGVVGSPHSGPANPIPVSPRAFATGPPALQCQAVVPASPSLLNPCAAACCSLRSQGFILGLLMCVCVFSTSSLVSCNLLSLRTPILSKAWKSFLSF